MEAPSRPASGWVGSYDVAPMFGRRFFGGTLTGGVAGAAVGLLAAGFLLGCGGDTNVGDDPTDTTLAADDPGAPLENSQTLVRIGNADPGDIVSLSSDGTVVEWVNRESGEIVAIDIASPDLAPEAVAEVSVSTRGRDWGLLDSMVLDDGRRFATWTQPGAGDFENDILVIGEIVDGVAVSVIWNAGRAGTTNIGGQLDELDGRIVLGLGQDVGWADGTATRGAIVTLDPDGTQDQEPVVISDGYVDPRAFAVFGDDVWVWDRAGDRDPDEPGVSDEERFGRADLGDRGDLTRSSEPRRDATAIVELPDGRIGVCGDADGALWAYEPDSGTGTLDAVEAVMVCSTAATVLADGTIVTIADLDGRPTLQIRRP